MFENGNFTKSLAEEDFEHWLESGRASKIRFNYMLIIWDELDKEFRPIYLERREEIDDHQNDKLSVGSQVLVAAYDLYSESKIG